MHRNTLIYSSDAGSALFIFNYIELRVPSLQNKKNEFKKSPKQKHNIHNIQQNTYIYIVFLFW